MRDSMTAGSDPPSGDGERRFDAVCVGETMAMVTPEKPEPLEFARNVVICPGGAESNVAMYLAGLGHRVGWVSRLGADALGRRVLRDVSATGVDTSLVEIDEDAPTGVFFKDPGPGGTRVFYYRRGSAASLMNAALLGPALEGRPKLVHITGITPALSPECSEMIDALVSMCRMSRVAVSFDVNFRKGLWSRELAAPRLIELAREADIVFVGLDEARELWGSGCPADLRRLIAGPEVLVVKNGATGATAYYAGGSEFVPSLDVEVSEPVGAGDAFAAGWLSGLLQDLPQVQRLRLGHLVARAALLSTADHQTLPRGPWFEEALVADNAQWAEVKASPRLGGVTAPRGLDKVP